MNRGELGILANKSLLLFDEAAAVFTQMLDGWSRQQRARLLKEETIRARARIVAAFQKDVDSYPWDWTSSDFESFLSDRLSRSRGVSHSTTRSYADAIRQFCHYISSPDYPWADECLRRFGSITTQIVSEWNSPVHKPGVEGRPSRRKFSDFELQALFDVADDRVQRPLAGRKGQHCALRDAQMIKTTFAFGLRRREVVGLDVVDLGRNPDWPDLGKYAAIRVRFGKSSNGGPAKGRTVLAVPEFIAASLGLRQWVEIGRPTFDSRPDGPLWPSERIGRLSSRGFEARFQSIREEAGLPSELTLHCLRHTYVSRMNEAGYAERFIMDQVGHTYASTTALYSHIGDEYRHAALGVALGRMNDLERASDPALREVGETA
jgi:integrase/recombinase XerC